MREKYSDVLVEFFELMSSWENSIVEKREISLRQMHLIEVVGNEGQVRMKILADKLGVTTGSLTVMIKRLVDSGYVVRRKDFNDKRSYFIELTDSGKEEYKIHHLKHVKLIEKIVTLIGTDESVLFFAGLEKIRTCMGDNDD